MIKVLFGTESGNSEMAADDIAALLSSGGTAAKVVPMEARMYKNWRPTIS